MTNADPSYCFFRLRVNYLNWEFSVIQFIWGNKRSSILCSSCLLTLCEAKELQKNVFNLPEIRLTTRRINLKTAFHGIFSHHWYFFPTLSQNPRKRGFVARENLDHVVSQVRRTSRAQATFLLLDGEIRSGELILFLCFLAIMRWYLITTEKVIFGLQTTVIIYPRWKDYAYFEA